MHKYIEKSEEKRSAAAANHVFQQRKTGQTFQFVDNRPQTVAQRKIKEALNSTPRVLQQKAYQAMANSYALGIAQRHEKLENKKIADGVIQLKLIYSLTSGKFSGNATRPAWSKRAEDSMLEGYNSRQGTTEKKLDYKNKKLDRAHVLSFHSIQTSLVAFLNKNSNENDFKKECITPLTKELKKSKKAEDIVEVKNIQDALKNMIFAMKQKNNHIVVLSWGDKLLTRLNSVSSNLRAASKYLNAYVGNHIDPSTEKVIATGQVRLDKHTKNVLTTTNAKVLRTPNKKEALVGSEGRLPFANFTPDSKDKATKAPYSTRKIKSKNVSDALYKTHHSVLNIKDEGK